LGKWRKSHEKSRAADGTRHTLKWSDADSGLSISLEATEFSDDPVVEWVMHLANTGTTDSPLLHAIWALDLAATHLTAKPVLHYAKGAVCSMDDFQPLTSALGPGADLRVQPGGGRSSSDFLPFFNLESSPAGGLVIGLGWSGEWLARFSVDDTGVVRVRGGQATARFVLRPGERVRTPRIALLFYSGDWIHGQNLWRRFVLAHHRPQAGGQPLEPPIFNGNWGGTRAADHLANIQAIVNQDLPIDAYWIDAEWFGEGPWHLNPGNWRVKKDLYPEGFRPISELLHQHGRRLLLWFEPERVCESTSWAAELRPWLLSVPKEQRHYNWGTSQADPNWVKWESQRNQIKDGDQLLNLGIPEARRFLTEFISDRIKEFGLDCYRHDANIAPLEFWRAADPADRQGLTEVRWVEGLYEFWDELLRRHPSLILDNCASGGRRIDLETMSRSVPFWRTDFPSDPVGKQCHTYGVSSWVPLNATGAVRLGRDSDYAWWSSVSASIAFELFGAGETAPGSPVLTNFPFGQAKLLLEQYRSIKACFLGDYYPLTSYSQKADAWMAWQFHRADLGRGFVQAFRRAECAQAALRLPLRGLQAKARYTLGAPCGPATRTVSGAELMQDGVEVVLTNRSSAAVIVYQVAQQKRQ
jgi:alpha-galactosidase